MCLYKILYEGKYNAEQNRHEKSTHNLGGPSCRSTQLSRAQSSTATFLSTTPVARTHLLNLWATYYSLIASLLATQSTVDTPSNSTTEVLLHPIIIHNIHMVLWHHHPYTLLTTPLIYRFQLVTANDQVNRRVNFLIIYIMSRMVEIGTIHWPGVRPLFI